jgi:hypothetical protein
MNASLQSLDGTELDCAANHLEAPDQYYASAKPERNFSFANAEL